MAFTKGSHIGGIEELIKGTVFTINRTTDVHAALDFEANMIFWIMDLLY